MCDNINTKNAGMCPAKSRHLPRRTSREFVKRIPESWYGTISSTSPGTALLLVPQTDLLALAFTLPKPWSLEDLLHKLLEGTLDPIFGLCTGLCSKEGGMLRFKKEFRTAISKMQ